MSNFDITIRGLFIASIALLFGFCVCIRSEAAEVIVNPYESIHMTEQEARELELILAMEAQTEGFDGQCAVVEVIFNRVLSDDPYFPDTVHGVLSQKGQFATWKYINKPYNTPNEVQSDAIAEVLAVGPCVLPSMDYVFFSRGKQGYARDHIKIGRHWFGRSKR